MGMDPKQQRVLRDGTASGADQPRAIDRESVREQAENPPVPERPRARRRTAAVADIRVHLPSGTPVDEVSRTLGGGERIPEMGESDRRERGGEERATPIERPRRDEPDRIPSGNGEARRTLSARREHSKGDGNFPEPEAAPIDERPEDRSPRDLPKAKDDRSAPKGNTTAGQGDRNPALEVRDDYEPRRARRVKPPVPARTPARRKPRAARAAAPKRATTRASAKPQKAPRRKAGAASKGKRPNAQLRVAKARGSRKPATKRATRNSGPRARSGATRGGKR
jgi:hypothetical protein